MKILIAYDGSASANAVFGDLENAGLPNDVEALVLSMADVIIPPPMDPGEELIFSHEPEGIRRAHKHAELMLKEADESAARAGEEIKNAFPEWKVNHLALADSPAWAILREADQRQADLIVVGAQGHSVLGGRLILGSISQRVVYEATCSVRIARKRSIENHLRILIGLDNSPFSRAAVEAVCHRKWPDNTRVRLLAVVDTVMAITPDLSLPSVQKWIEVGDEENWDKVARVFEPEVRRLQEAGLDAAITIRKGNPADEILEEAEAWNADCIFLGPKGARGIERLLLGSVSSAVSARATCSVEIVRPQKATAG